MPNHCPACGVEVVEGSTFCHRCGARIAEGGEAAPKNTRPAAAAKAEMVEEPGVLGNLGRGRQEPERDLWSAQISPRAMIASWIVVSLLAACCIFLAFYTNWTWTFLGVALALCVFQQCRYWYLRITRKYRLTTYRLIEETGILSRTTNRIELIDIDDIQLVRNLIDRMVGIGRIRMLTHDVSHPTMEIAGIEQVQERFDLLEQAVRNEKRRREIRLEAT